MKRSPVECLLWFLDCASIELLYIISHVILEFSERSFVCCLWLRSIWGTNVGFKWRKARKKQNPEFVHNIGSFFYRLFYCCIPLFGKPKVKSSRTILLVLTAQSYINVGVVEHTWSNACTCLTDYIHVYSSLVSVVLLNFWWDTGSPVWLLKLIDKCFCQISLWH